MLSWRIAVCLPIPFVRCSSVVGAMVSLPRPDSHTESLRGLSTHTEGPYTPFPSRNTSVGLVQTSSRLSLRQYCRELRLTSRPAVREYSTVSLAGAWRERRTEGQHVQWRRFHLAPQLGSSDDSRKDGTLLPVFISPCLYTQTKIHTNHLQT